MTFCTVMSPNAASPPPSICYSHLQSRQPKFQSFFGPGVRAVLSTTETGVDVALISDGSEAGGAASDEEVLPPLMPGLAPRVVKKAK